MHLNGEIYEEIGPGRYRKVKVLGAAHHLVAGLEYDWYAFYDEVNSVKRMPNYIAPVNN